MLSHLSKSQISVTGEGAGASAGAPRMHSRVAGSSCTCPALGHHPGLPGQGNSAYLHRVMNGLELRPGWMLSSSQVAGQPQYQKIPRKQKWQPSTYMDPSNRGAWGSPAKSCFWHQGISDRNRGRRSREGRQPQTSKWVATG